MKATGMRLLVWIMLNLFLIAAILFVLDYFQIWSVSSFYNDWSKPDPEVAMKIEDPLLIEKEEIKKQKLSLVAREEILKSKQIALKELIKQHDEFKTAMKQKSDQLLEREEKLKDDVAKKNDREKNIEYLANVISNMPPDASVERLEAIAAEDPLLVIEIFEKIDKKAAELGQGSMVPLYVSKMNVKKVQEFMRLKAKFPGEATGLEEADFEAANANEQPATE